MNVDNPPWCNVAPEGRLLRPSEVAHRTGLSRSQIYAMIAEGHFPPFLKISARASALPEAWLNAFVATRAGMALSQKIHNFEAEAVENEG